MEEHNHGHVRQDSLPDMDHAAMGHGDMEHDDHAVHTQGQHAGHSTAMFKNRFWLTLALSVPVVYFSPMVGHLIGYTPPQFPGAPWIAPILGTVIFFYGGQPFLRGGWQEIKARQPGMMLLISMVITVAFIASWVTSLGLGGFDLDFWWELALLVAITLLGHWIEMRAFGSARGALDALAALLPDGAERVIDGGTETIGITELVAGDIVMVRSGARMPADGLITEGAAEVDESMITGESKTVPRSVGDPVVARTVATDSSLRLKVTAVGDDTALAGNPAAGGRGPVIHLPGPGTGGPGRCVPVLLCRRCRRHYLHRLVAAGQHPGCGDSHRDGAGHCLPPCSRPGHPTGDRDLHRAGRPRRGLDQKQDGPGADAHHRCGLVRQDRHPDQGRTGTHRGGSGRGPVDR